MRERPILFSGEMVRRLLDGSKTQTRRIVQSPAKNMQRAGMEVIKRRAPGDSWYGNHVWSMRGRTGVWGDYTHEQFLAFCSYGQPGDRLWVRETFYCDHCFAGDYETTWRTMAVANRDVTIDRVACEREWRGGDDVMMHYRADVPSGRFADAGYWSEPGSHWKPSIHMPRWAARIVLEITDVRVERLQAITEDDARAEGIAAPDTVADCDHARRSCEEIECMGPGYRAAFARLWDAINGERAPWSADPWVWRISFRRVQ